MDLSQLIILAIVQGATEFLPISSQAHLALVREFLFDIPTDSKEAILFDVAMHVGSLGAVMMYFAKETRDAVTGPFTLIADLRQKRSLRTESKLAVLLIIATAPVILFALALEATIGVEAIRNIEVIAWCNLIFAGLLYVSDRYFPSERDYEQWDMKSAAAMGAAQALSILPGVSRSGVAMTMGRFLGYDRREAARIAMVMALPTIVAAGLFETLKLVQRADLALTVDAVIAAALAFVSAYIAINLMMRWLARQTFLPFVIYRLVLGVALLAVVYGGGV